MGRKIWRRDLLAAVAVLTGAICAAEDSSSNKTDPAISSFDDASIEFFEKEVRPILVARCLECHGNGQGDPKGGLRLNSRAATIKGGDTGPAVVPGNLKESLLISAVQYGDLYQMPPKSKLPPHEIAILVKWVERGAPWPVEKNAASGTPQSFDLKSRVASHWCWQELANPTVPKTKSTSWPRTTVDQFILAKLEDHGLQPAPPAEKHALLRRVYFDLIGLPPSAEEVEAFVNDSSPQAFEHVVDRLLASVQYGERWGRHWLDLVRYAETRGHEFEPIIPNAWQYRDYIIRAINADVPHDRLLTEHIAGDLIEPRCRHVAEVHESGKQKAKPQINEAILGTGFWFLGEEVHSPVDIRKDETDRMDNRLDVMSKTFLGLTVGCARCHDHKFDAISQRDYYALVGYLISSSYRQVRVQTHENDRRIAEELHSLRSQTLSSIASKLVNQAQPTLAKLDQYLIAARRLIDDGIAFEDIQSRPSAAEVLFADFEGNSWGDWKTEGSAFGDKPPRKEDNIYDAPLDGFRGERFVNSHRNAVKESNNAGSRDAQTGRLISPLFAIKHDTISFLIGGGNHAGRTCMNLVVDGKIVRTATGQNSGSLRSEKWDVSELKGKKAHLEIVDAETGGWGHILVDQILFLNATSSEPAKSNHRVLAVASQKKVAELAKGKGLDANVLSRWCEELAIAKTDRNHPLQNFAGSVPEGQITSIASTPVTKPEELIVDFGASRNEELIQDGVSFGLRPATVGDLQTSANSADPKLHVATIGGWNRDLFWKDLKLTPETDDDHGGLGSWHRHGRTVRTPEFTLKSNRLWYLVRGSVRVYVAANSHLVIAGPLHGSLLREYKHADQQWHWVEHGLELYRGNRMHVEFTPIDDGECAVAMVVQSQDHPKPPVANVEFAKVFPLGPVDQQAKLIQERLVRVLSDFERRQQKLDGISKDLTAADLILTNWFLERFDVFVDGDATTEVQAVLATLHRQESKLAEQVQWESQLAPAMLDGNGVDELLLIRGNSNTPRDPVHRHFLDAFANQNEPHGPPPVPGSGRLQLARRMIDSPLAARVAVNRIWHHLFGRGIVPSVDNMGVLGQPPTHPELLDHLAIWFVKDGWSTKRLIKLLVLSRTYQMSSHPSEPADTQDPDNLLWHRMPIKRLEGEVIRDALLAVSGRLNRTSFGPSVPIHLTPFMEGRGRPGVNGPLDGNGRRSIYIAVRRNFLSPMMLAFDTPSPFSTVGRRTSSNVPAQALILMNDPLVIDLASTWANRLLTDSTLTPEQRIDAMYMTAYSRKATAAEKSEAIGFLEAQSRRFGLPDSQRRTAPQAWADLCHVVFNLKEFVFIE